MRLRLQDGALSTALLILIILLGVATVNAQQHHPQPVYPTYPSALPTLPIIGHAPPIVAISGTIRVLVVAVAFPDVKSTLTIDQIRQLWTLKVAAYFHELSYGKLTVQSNVTGWYTLPWVEEHYGRNCLSINDANCSGANQSWHIAADAVPLAEKDVNFSNYDYYVFIHSGRGQETSLVSYDIWSVTYMGASVATHSKTINTFSIVPELEAPPFVPYGDWCVEFAHDLGVPDLFNTTVSPYSGLSMLGPWDLMDKGSWNSDGWLPAQMSAWPRIQLGFIEGAMIATAKPRVTYTYTVDPIEVASNNVHVIKIVLNNTNPAQYYLVEVRTLQGFDAGLPSAGVLITYVDDNLVSGKVHVIDSHPGIPDLINAIWSVGETFKDTKKGLSIAVTGTSGNAYQITVNRNDVAATSSAKGTGTGNSSTSTQIKIANVTLNIELAETPAAQQKGLSGRTFLANDQGMLFVFDRQDYWTFWMINMKFPLDMIWFNSARQVVFKLENLQPCTPDNCPTFTPDAAASYVLEVNAGFAAAHHIQYGTTFTFLNPQTGSSGSAQSESSLAVTSVSPNRENYGGFTPIRPNLR